MSNDFYNHNDGIPATLTRGASASIRSEFDLVQAGFDKLPTLAQTFGDAANYVVAGGSADAWTASVAPTVLTSYTDGLVLRVKFAAANTTTTPTLNLNSLGAKQIVSEQGGALNAGDIGAGEIATLTYNATFGKFQMTLGNSVASAQASAATATAQATIATAQAVIATAEAVIATSGAASASASAASVAAAAATAGVYPNTAATNVPRGLTQASVGTITAGSGGTAGTFALAWAGGNFSINPTGTFTVSGGGALTAVTITGPGLYIGSSPTVPTPSFAASAGLGGGAAVVLTAQFLVTSGQGYWVQSATGKKLDRYKNVSGVATSDTANVSSVPTVTFYKDLQESPRDAIGLWALDDYAATPQSYITNLAQGSPAASSNLKRAPRRAFNKQFYFKTNVTVVDNSVDGIVVGTTDAALLTCTGNWKLSMGTNSTGFPVGTFTLVATVKRHGGSDQPFAFSSDGGTTRSAATATSAYQRLTFTFSDTPTSFGLCLCSSDGVTGASLELESVEIFSGAADLGRTADDGNIYLGRVHTEASTVVASAMTNPAAGCCALPARNQFAKWTVSALVSQNSATSAPAIFSDLHDFSNFAFQGTANVTTPAEAPMSVNAQANFTNLLSGQNGQGQRGGFFNIVGVYHLLTLTYDGVAEELWLDDIKLLRWERTLAARSLKDLLFFVDLNGSAWHQLAGVIGLWDRALSAAEIRQFFYYQRVRNPSLTISGARSLRVLAVEGDSNHAGQLASCWPWLFSVNDSPENFGSIWASVGSRLDHTTDASLPTLATLSDRVSLVDGVIPPDKFDRTFVLTVGIGTNDLTFYSSTANFITALRAYCVARVAAGWTVCLFTLPPKDGDASFNSRRATVNTDIRANWALYGLASAGRVIDIAGDAIIGPDNSRSVNPTYWSDAIHFSDTGNAVVETYARAVINAI